MIRADHPEVAGDLQGLGVLLGETNRLAEAELLVRRALAIYEQSYGLDHPHVAEALNGLAWLLRDTNRLAEAELLVRWALAIYEQSYGLDHRRVAGDLDTLAALLQASDRLTEAESFSRRALQILLDLKRATGHPHPAMEAVIERHSSLLSQMGRDPKEVLSELLE
ncbi:MAG: tetratricopeptide repeat protein [Thermoguttaceae bacterium]|jgi:tetratricopeptide (TPR) repeat protein